MYLYTLVATRDEAFDLLDKCDFILYAVGGHWRVMLSEDSRPPSLGLFGRLELVNGHPSAAIWKYNEYQWKPSDPAYSSLLMVFLVLSEFELTTLSFQ